MNLSSAEKSDIALACYSDPVLFCKTFLLHWFPSDIPWVHRGILAILTQQTDFLLKYGEIDKIVSHFVYKDSSGNVYPMFFWEDNRLCLVAKDKVAIMMPRGFSKTTIVNAHLIFDIVYQDCSFSLLVSETLNHSKAQLKNIKRELESNAMLLEVFGAKASSRQDAEKWTEDIITTVDQITVVARGRGGQVRGLNVNGKRPDRIIVDDVEDKESVSTDEQIKKTRRWFYADLLPVKAKTGARYVVLGTLLAANSLLSHLENDPAWTFIRFGAVDNDGVALWEGGMTLAQLDMERKSYALAGNLAEFYMEYYSTVRDEATALFRKEFFRYSTRPALAAKAIVIDPAISEKKRSDSTTIAVVGMTERGQIHVCEVWGKRGATPREQIDKYFELVFAHDPNLFGVESIAYQAALIHLLREEMFRKKKYFEIVPITHAKKKFDRIKGILQPRYSAGYVTHERIFSELEAQLLDFGGAGVHDDFPDVVAMAVALLDPYAAQAADGDKDLGNDEYEALDYEGFRATP